MSCICAMCEGRVEDCGEQFCPECLIVILEQEKEKEREKHGDTRQTD